MAEGFAQKYVSFPNEVYADRPDREDGSKPYIE